MSGVLTRSELEIAAPAPRSDLPMPLSLRGVSKAWEKGRVPVLDRVDLDLDIGARVRIAGRNGVGKTTLMRIAAGLIDPDHGRAEVWGTSAIERPQRYQRLVSFLPAGDRGLYARLSVRRQLDFWARIAMVPRREVGARVEEAIETFDLRELAGRRVDRMSMGQRQRLRIAMTFLPRPDVVLLDEPLTSLDGDGAELLYAAIEELLDKGGALLWCSPAGEHMDYEFDRTYMLEAGKLVPA
ncbi:MAG TPA: ABC transporter ATP-binding protein [Solirubrobacterales bacterium]|jgi:ABC-2 type transport system ATP-binding protein|nr:ABC transporter ATP-binding protein [Solirubrobacterales bacterium]